MSMELAVWEGRAPADADEAARDLEVLYESYVTRRWAQEPRPPAEPPTPRVLRFARALSALFPDDGPEEDDVWAAGPLESAAIGRLVPWSVDRYDRVETVVTRVAERYGLVCHSPGGRVVLTSLSGERLRRLLHGPAADRG